MSTNQALTVVHPGAERWQPDKTTLVRVNKLMSNTAQRALLPQPYEASPELIATIVGQPDFPAYYDTQ
jgi:hypothetical protein